MCPCVLQSYTNSVKYILHNIIKTYTIVVGSSFTDLSLSGKILHYSTLPIPSYFIIMTIDTDDDENDYDDDDNIHTHSYRGTCAC